MGSCSSVLSDIPVVSNVSSKLNTTSCDKSKQGIIQATNRVISAAIIKSVNNCSSSVVSSQNIEILCENKANPTEIYEENAACTTCMNNVFQGMQDHYRQEREQNKEKPQAAKVRLSFDTQLDMLNKRMFQCGVETCKACSLINVSENNVINSGSDCYTQLTSTANFSTNIRAILKQQLLSNKDVLAGVVNALNNTNIDSITDTISNDIETRVTSNYLQNLATAIQSQQSINVVSSSTSVANVSQYNMFQSIVSNVNNANIASDVINNSLLTAIEKSVNQENTLNDFGEVIFNVVNAPLGAINKTVQYVMISVLSFLGLLTLILIIYLIVKFRKHKPVIEPGYRIQSV